MSDAPALVSLAIVDRMSSRFPDAGSFIADVVANVNSEWRRCRVAGAAIVAASWVDGQIFLETRAGPAPLTVEAVSDFLKSKKATA